MLLFFAKRLLINLDSNTLSKLKKYRKKPFRITIKINKIKEIKVLSKQNNKLAP